MKIIKKWFNVLKAEGDYLKMETINEIIKAYEEDDLDKLLSELFLLALSYNKDIREGKSYNHDFKHILFKINCVRNPIGVKYKVEDYNKTKQTFWNLLSLMKAINNPEKNTEDIFQKDFSIDKRIIGDIIDILAYTECFYNMNSVNTARMDENEICNMPFIEQLITILLFHQDQTRLVRQQYHMFLNKDGITGMELSIANRDVQYYDNLKSSVTDNFESILEGMNEIVHYLYYRYGNSLPTEVIDKDIEFHLVRPYENVKFEQYLYIASQRYFLRRIEEGIRYGYYRLNRIDKTEHGIPAYVYALESDEKYKARNLGVIRRENQVRNLTLVDYKSQDALMEAQKKLAVLADDLINSQKEEYLLLNFNYFNPDKSIFKKAEGVSKIKESIVKSLTKEYYLDCDVKGIKVRDLITAYSYLYTLSEILYFASEKLIDENNQDTYIKELSLVDVAYLATELSRIHEFEINYAQKLIDRFIFHEKKNRFDDVFAQPLLKISDTQVVLSQALLDQVNLDRVIERQFIRHNKNVAEIGRIFEKKFINKLKQGYSTGVFDFKYKEIPNFFINENEVKYVAFDGREIEFDGIAVLGEYLILTELKAVMTSYDLTDLEERKKNVKKAIEQLHRRAESVKYDWEEIRSRVSIELPEKTFNQEHIILIACTDTYDYTPLKIGNVFITDDSTYLKYFTNPYVDAIEAKPGDSTIRNVNKLWKKGYPDAIEFMEYLMNPITTQSFSENMEKQLVPSPVMDEKDYAIFIEDYKLIEDPIIATLLKAKGRKGDMVETRAKKIYPNDPCPCGSGKKYKKCCKNKN